MENLDKLLENEEGPETEFPPSYEYEVGSYLASWQLLKLTRPYIKLVL